MKTIFLSFGLMLVAGGAFGTTQTQSSQDKPWRVYMLSGTMNTSDNDHTNDDEYLYPNFDLFYTVDSQATSAKSVVWVNGLAGGGSGTSLNNSVTVGFIYPYTNYDNSFESDSNNFD
jgi:hypothetical protein